MEDSFIRLFPHGHQFPVPTATCKQPAHECFPLYFIENEFVLYIDDFDGAWTSKVSAAIRDILGRLGWHCYDDAPTDLATYLIWTFINACGIPNWQNLLHWLETCRKGRCVCWDENGQGNDDAEHMVLGGVFGILGEMREQSWEGVVAVLDHFRSALKFVDSRWG